MMRVRLLHAALFLTFGCVETRYQSHIHRFRQRSKEERQRSDKWVAQRYRDGVKNVSIAAITDCICSKPSPFQSSANGIVLGFADMESTGEYYNWTNIDVVAWASEELVCRAHCHGARALVASPSFALDKRLKIKVWVDRVVKVIHARNYDGIVFDYEEPVTPDQARIYVKLVRETKRACHGCLVVTCVAWSPDGIDDRNYPVRALARVSGKSHVLYLFVPQD